MARIIILIAIISIALILWHKIGKASGPERKKLILWSVIGSVVAVLGVLAVTGHLNIITAMIASAIALLPKLVQFAKYIPFISRLYAQKKQQNGQQTPPARGNQKMSRDEAMEILALKPDHNADDVIQAHRRMMQKMHPDRGGSDYLAAQINQAKETLLS